MKRTLFRSFGVTLLALTTAVLLTLGATSIQAADITLKYSDHDPLGGMRTNFLKNVWLPEIEKQTNGKVKIQDFWLSLIHI